MAKKKYIDPESYIDDNDLIANYSTADEPQRDRVKVAWAHLQGLQNYTPRMGRHRESAERTLSEANEHIQKAFVRNSSSHLGKAIEGLSTVTSALVNHLGANHPIAQEALANHAGAIAAHAAHVEASAKASN